MVGMIKKLFPRYQIWNLSLWIKFKEWRIGKQSEKFAKELKDKNYKPRKPWNVGIWK
tara:strand:+ start:145 stop:315 length:171 start_codon:yes stop_codon:yes gene_type:complete